MSFEEGDAFFGDVLLTLFAKDLHFLDVDAGECILGVDGVVVVHEHVDSTWGSVTALVGVALKTWGEALALRHVGWLADLGLSLLECECLLPALVARAQLGVAFSRSTKAVLVDALGVGAHHCDVLSEFSTCCTLHRTAGDHGIDLVVVRVVAVHGCHDHFGCRSGHVLERHHVMRLLGGEGLVSVLPLADVLGERVRVTTFYVARREKLLQVCKKVRVGLAADDLCNTSLVVLALPVDGAIYSTVEGVDANA